MKIIQHIEHLAHPLFCTLSTVDEAGLPWASPVYFAYDANATIYWTSSHDSQHSKNIRHSSNVFITMFKEGLSEGSMNNFGLYIKGKAYELQKIEEITYARNILTSRIHKESTHPESFMGNSPRKVYKCVPEQAWTNSTQNIKAEDGGVHECDVRVTI